MKQGKPNRVLSIKWQNTLFQQHNKDSTHEHHQMVNMKSDWLYSLQLKKLRSYIQSAKTRPGAGCSSDHEHLIAKSGLKLKKVGKAIRPLRYDLNQIPYNKTVEVANRFKGLDLIDRVPEELWMEVCNIVQKGVIKATPKKKKCQKAKWLSEKALQIAEKRREEKGKGEKERYNHLNSEFQRVARRDKKVFLSDQSK